MRWKGLVWALPIVLLAQSPALAKMHIDSPPGIRSFIFVLIWIGLMTWLFRTHYGADRLALAFGVGTVATAVVLGEYVDSLLRVFLRAGPDDRLPIQWVLPCVCLVSLAAQSAAAVWSGRMQGGRAIRFREAVSVRASWAIALVPGIYVALKYWVF